jgi:hypothetical protein
MHKMKNLLFIVVIKVFSVFKLQSLVSYIVFFLNYDCLLFTV